MNNQTPAILNFTEVLPHPALKEWVTHYRLKSMELSSALFLPNFSPIFQGLIFDLAPNGSFVFQKTSAQQLQHNVYYVGQAISPSSLHSDTQRIHLIAVNFTPLGLFKFTGCSMHNLTDTIVDAEHLFGKEILLLYQEILETPSPFEQILKIDTFLCRKIVQTKHEVSANARIAVNKLFNTPNLSSIKELEQLTHASTRTLERNFKEELGISPKMFHRLIRFNAAKNFLHQHPQTDWWEVVVRFGYYDHSHFISEFKLFSHMTPLQYVALFGSSLTHHQNLPIKTAL